MAVISLAILAAAMLFSLSVCVGLVTAVQRIATGIVESLRAHPRVPRGFRSPTLLAVTDAFDSIDEEYDRTQVLPA